VTLTPADQDYQLQFLSRDASVITASPPARQCIWKPHLWRADPTRRTAHERIDHRFHRAKITYCWEVTGQHRMVVGRTVAYHH
jgi:hypothetical protein